MKFYIAMIIVLTLVIYLAISFVLWEFNPAKWNEIARFILGTSFVAATWTSIKCYKDETEPVP